MPSAPPSKRTLVLQAFEEAALGAIVYGLDGAVLVANPAARRLLGYEEHELHDLQLQSITHPDDAEVDVEGLQDLLAGTGAAFTVTKRYVCKSGETAAVRQTISLARDRRGRPRFFIAQLRDVTLERQTQHQNDVLFRLSPDMLAVAPAGLEVLDRVNPAWERTLGWTPGDLARTPLVDFIHPSHRERIAGVLAGAADIRGGLSFRTRFRRADGEYRWLDWNTYLGEGHRYCVVRDVSHHESIDRTMRETNRRLRDREAQISSLISNMGDGLVTFDAEGTVQSFNAAAVRLFGYTAEQIIGRNVELLLPEQLRSGRQAELQAYLEGGEPSLVGRGRSVLRAVRRDGSEFHIELTVNAVPSGEAELFVAVMRDVTERRKAEFALYDEKERLRVTLESIGDGVITTDTSGHVTYLNPAAERMTGWSREEALGKPLSRVFVVSDTEDGTPSPSPIDAVLRDGERSGLAEDSVLDRRGGGRFAIEDSAAPIRNTYEELIGVVLVFHDVSEARRIAAEMTHQASHDPLTGLVNRRGFARRLDAVLKQDGSRKPIVVLFMDLDQFKVVNDSGGHAAGDELLRRLGGVFRKRLRQADTLARLGGDEFAVILEDCSVADGHRIAESLRQAISQFPFTWENRTFRVGVSIGMVVVDGEAITREELMRRADAACYLAKDRGRNRIHVYKSDDTHRSLRRGEMGWVGRIHQALADGNFVLCRQASMSLASADSTHFETLLRMRDSAGRLILPMTFIPAAERYGLMPEIDRWVIGAALDKLGAGAGHEVCFINLSGASLDDDSLPDFIQARVQASGVDAADVCFEITETAAIANLAHAEAMIGDIKRLGCRFALDDFGSGMSSFTYLKHLPVDYLKIDGAFVRHMDRDPIDRAMVEAINNIGHVMGIETIAEYVESQATVDLLAGIGVNYAQGFWIEKPHLWQ